MSEKNVKAIKSICEVYPGGQRLTGGSVAYDCVLDGTSLTAEQFSVSGKKIVDVYLSDTEDGSRRTQHGNYVIVRLDPNEADAELTGFDQPGPHGKWFRKTPEIRIRQTAEIMCAEGGSVGLWEDFLVSEGEIEPLVDLFAQHVFHSERTGMDLPYNLYLPEGYDEKGSYPLVMFIHDRGPLDENVKTTLRQGVGALVWVLPEEQKKHPCIVLAPQYAKVPSGDGNPDMLETTFDLYEYIAKTYAVDPKRWYTTGQSMGCMSSIAMGIRRPDFFTAYLLVAGQWDPDAMATISDAKMFVIISRGDPKAYPEMNAALEKMEANGAVVQRAEWDQDGGVIPEEQVKELMARPGNIHYAVLKTEKRDVSCHMDTWKVAYGVEGARDWLFAQTK